MGREGFGDSMKKIFLTLALLFLCNSAFAAYKSDQFIVKDAGGDTGTISGSFSVNRSFTLPDEDGTICTTGSGCGGGSLVFADDASTSGNVTYVGCSDSISSAITAATAGDTLVLGSCTYTVSAAISISKAITLIGQGPEKTVLNNTGSDISTISSTADGFHLSGIGFTGSDVDNAILINCEGGSVCTDVSIENFKIVITGVTGSTEGIRLQDSSADIRNGYISLTTALSAANQSKAIFKRIQSTAEANTTLRVTNVRIESSSTGASGSDLLRGVMSWNNGSDESVNSHYVYMRNVDVKLSPDSTVATEAFELQGARGTAYIFGGTLDGGTGGGSNVNNDIRVESGDVAYLYGTVLANNRNNNQGTMTPSGVIQAAGINGGQPTKPETTTSTALVGHSALSVTSGDGGDTSGSGTQTGGAAGAISITGGVGGVASSANTASTGGAGSSVTITSGTGGAASATGTNVGGAGGTISLVGGSGGNSSGGSSNTGGAGSSIYAYPGTGGTGATANGSDGNVYLLSNSGLSDVNGNVNVNFSSDSDVIDSRIKLDVRANGNNAGIGATAYSGTAATTGTLILGKSRGTQASSTTVAADDDLGNIRFFGYDGTNWQNTASIQAEADGTVSSGNMPSRVSIFTGPIASEVRRFTIFNDGSALFGGSTTTIPSGNTYSFDAISTSTTPTIGIVRTDTTITNGEVAGQLRFHGKDTQLTTQNAYAAIQAIANGDTTTDAAAGDLAFFTTTTTVAGSPVEAGRFTTDGHLRLGGRTAASELRFLEPSGSGSNYTAFKAQAQAGDVTYTLPAADAAVSGYVLSSDAAGTLSWVSQSAGSGTKTYAVFTPTDNQPTAANYATLDTRNSILVLDFDTTTEESAVFAGIIPEAASLGSGLIVRIHWMATSATTGDARWGVQFERGTTDADADSYDTACEATSTTNGTSGVETVTAITCTTIDSATAGDSYRIRVYRDVTDAADTMAGDAELRVVEVRSAA